MSERTEESLKARVRETPLIERLNESRKRIAAMCSERRGPKMTIPVEYYDDDFFICATLEDARDEVARLRGAIMWALGYTDFRARENGEGPYWWRPELRRRAALTPEQIESAQATLTPQGGKGVGA